MPIDHDSNILHDLTRESARVVSDGLWESQDLTIGKYMRQFWVATGWINRRAMPGNPTANADAKIPMVVNVYDADEHVQDLLSETRSAHDSLGPNISIKTEHNPDPSMPDGTLI